MARFVLFAMLAASITALTGCGVQRTPRALISPSYSAAQADTPMSEREPVAAAQAR